MGSINVINGGLDVESIVDKLIQVERLPVTRLQTQSTAAQRKISEYQAFNGKVSGLLDKVNAVLFGGESNPLQASYAFEDRFADSIFAARTASSSDEDRIEVTASTGSGTGRYAITVTSLASAKTMASANFADTGTTTVGTGDLILQIGSSDPVVIAVDSTNNTLQGVRDAINSAHAGVTATIVNDGSANPYRLILSADETGTENAFTITNGLTGGQSLGLTQTAAASDAVFEVNGVAVTRSSNTVTDAIDGVTFKLKSKTATAVDITVERDLEAVVTGLRDFVTAYNELNTFISAEFKYNATSRTAGVLSGDSTLRNAQAAVRARLTQGITNSFTSYRVIGEIGLEFNNDGSLSLNEADLRRELGEDLTGVAALLLGNGTPGEGDSATATDGRVTYTGKTSATEAGTYAIEITSLAAQAVVTSSREVTALGSDETLSISYNGSETTVNLLAGDTLQAVLTKINDALTASGAAAAASSDGAGHITVTTTLYGSSETVTVTSNQPDAEGSTGFGTIGLTGTGSNLAGTINGHAAVANGLTLTGASGQPEEGLVITVAQTTTGSYGSVTLTPGVAGDEGASILVNLRTTLRNITDPLAGPVHNATDGLNSTIRQLRKQIAAYEERILVKQELLTREFARADEALKMLSMLQTSLNSQIGSLRSII